MGYLDLSQTWTESDIATIEDIFNQIQKGFDFYSGSLAK